MIIVTVKYSVKPGYRDKVMELAKEVARFSRTEKGCLTYDQLPSAENDREIFVLEKWETINDLVAHSNTSQFVEFNENRKPYVVEGSRSIQVFEANEVSL